MEILVDAGAREAVEALDRSRQPVDIHPDLWAVRQLCRPGPPRRTPATCAGSVVRLAVRRTDISLGIAGPGSSRMAGSHPGPGALAVDAAVHAMSDNAIEERVIALTIPFRCASPVCRIGLRNPAAEANSGSEYSGLRSPLSSPAAGVVGTQTYASRCARAPRPSSTAHAGRRIRPRHGRKSSRAGSTAARRRSMSLTAALRRRGGHRSFALVPNLDDPAGGSCGRRHRAGHGTARLHAESSPSRS